jgi:hypothetical protein
MEELQSFSGYDVMWWKERGSGSGESVQKSQNL